VENSNFVDQGGNLRFHGTPAQAQEIYEQHWKDEAIYARRALMKADSTEKDLAQHTAEAIQRRMDARKAAFAADGYTVTEPIPEPVKHAADVSGIRLGAQSADYTVDLSPIANANPQLGMEMRALFAELEMNIGLAQGIADQMVKDAVVREKAMSDPAVWEQFKSDRRAELLKRAGGSEDELNNSIELLQTPFVEHQIQVAAKDAVNQSSINQADVRSIQIRLPTAARQESFGAAIKIHEQLRAIENEALRQADHLFQTLLHQTFAD
jgi:hypothetical protein